MKDLGTLIMVGGGVQQVNAVKIAQDSGYKVLVTDRNKNAPCSKIADYFLVVDGRNVEELAAYVIDRKAELNIKGIFTLTELVSTVAIVATAAELPSVSISSVIACQNKKICKKIWLNHNIPTPEGGSASSYEEALRWFNALGKKVFVKPVVGFGGMNSRKIESEHELKQLFLSQDIEMIVEECIDGSMHDVNGLYDEDGSFHPMGISDRLFLDKFPVETRTSSPSLLSQDKQDELYQLLENSTRALGVKWGPVKGDAVFIDKDFRMLEVAPRLHGPKSSLYVLPSSGVNCFELSLDVISAEKNLKSYEIHQKKFSVCQAIMPPIGSQFVSSAYIRYIPEQNILTLKGNNCTIKKYEDSSDVPAYVMVTGDDFNECNSIIQGYLT